MDCRSCRNNLRPAADFLSFTEFSGAVHCSLLLLFSLLDSNETKLDVMDIDAELANGIYPAEKAVLFLIIGYKSTGP